MEFLDGMAHRIAGRPMETELVLSMGIEIADALDAAQSLSKRIETRDAHVETKRDLLGRHTLLDHVC